MARRNRLNNYLKKAKDNSFGKNMNERVFKITQHRAAYEVPFEYARSEKSIMATSEMCAKQAMEKVGTNAAAEQ